MLDPTCKLLAGNALISVTFLLVLSVYLFYVSGAIAAYHSGQTGVALPPLRGTKSIFTPTAITTDHARTAMNHLL